MFLCRILFDFVTLNFDLLTLAMYDELNFTHPCTY